VEKSTKKDQLESMHQAVKFFETLLQASADGIVITDAAQNIIVVNEAFCSLFGKPLREVKETGLFTWLEQMNSDAPQRWAELEKGVRLKGTCRDVRFRVIGKKGTRYLSVNASLMEKNVPYPGEGSRTIISIWRDITAQEQAEMALKQAHDQLEQRVRERTEALRRSEEKYRAIYENLQEVYYESRLDGTILEVSPSVEWFCKYTREELLNMSLWDMYADPAERKRALEVLKKNKKITDYEIHIRDKDGTVVPCAVTAQLYFDEQGRPTKACGMLRNITERKRAEQEKKRLEQQLLQAQKMEAIGNLAGGVAHDFNNILGVIMGFTQLTIDDTPENSTIRHDLEKVMAAADRAKEVIKQILTFSRKNEMERRPVDIGHILEEALSLLRASLPATIEIRHRIPGESIPVLANSTQIHQVIMNISTNAAFAMREKGGILGITLKEVTIAPGDITGKVLNPGTYQQLSISDTGRGMPPDVQKRIFEPYFTTKNSGEGTGMGLAVVHGIVKSHGGYITVYSEPGKGTTFHVFFPVVEEAKVPGRTSRGSAPGGNERILFVDDVLLMAEMAKQTLEKLGYRVDTRTSSIEALEAFRHHPGKFDLVITDQTMPNMTGLQLAGQLKRIRPGIPVILCTGFSEAIDENNYKAMGVDGFIMKPIVRSEIAGTIRDLLDRE
jgi:PAS domain S-box-containing protein